MILLEDRAYEYARNAVGANERPPEAAKRRTLTSYRPGHASPDLNVRDLGWASARVSKEVERGVKTFALTGTNTRWVAGAAGLPDQPYDTDIIILALDRLEQTLAAIASARAQAGVSRHICVLDQGSCPEALRQLTDAVHGSDCITLLAAEQNLGVAGGRNVMSRLGHGRIIVALDNDAEFATADTVARMVAALDAEPRLGAIGCRIVKHDDASDDLSSWGYPVTLLPCAADCFDTVTFVGAGHAILRNAWQQAGGYDQKLFFCWEEFDFCLRAIALGWQIRYRGDIVVRHKVSAEQRVGWTTARWFYFVRNRLYIERKLDRSWISLAPRIAGYLVKGLCNGQPIQTLQAIAAAAAMAPRSASSWMPAAGIAYLTRNDRVHRGSMLRRLRREVLCRIGGMPNTVPAALE